MRYRLVLIRHGETQLNKCKAYMGCATDEELSDSGRNKARIYRKTFSSIVDENAYLICSPMKRCIETANIIFDREPDLIVDDLKEMDFGDFEGKSYEDLKDNDYYQKWIDSNGSLPFPNGESKAQFVDRTCRALRESVIEERVNVVVAHGGTIMAIMSRICGRDYYDFQVGNLEGYVLDYNYDSNKDTYNEISYLRINNGIHH